MNHRTAQLRNGFTLIEMLVVVAIIILLLAILTPALHGAISTSQIATCQSNLHQMTNGYLLYTVDNLGALVYGQPHDNRSDAFVKRGAGLDPIKQGALWQYIPDTDAWRCTADPNGNERSYVPVATLNGERWQHSSQMGTNRLSGVVNKSKQILFAEESDRRGWNIGSWMMRADDAGWDKWIDYVGMFHQNQTADSYSFLDGHVEHWQWEDPNTLYAGEVGKFYLYDPNNPDWLRLRKGYRQMATRGDCRLIN